jgi:hypothetical protein
MTWLGRPAGGVRVAPAPTSINTMRARISRPICSTGRKMWGNSKAPMVNANATPPPRTTPWKT